MEATSFPMVIYGKPYEVRWGTINPQEEDGLFFLDRSGAVRFAVPVFPSSFAVLYDEKQYAVSLPDIHDILWKLLLKFFFLNTF